MNNIPDNLGQRIGNINDLPDDLLSELNIGKPDREEEMLFAALRSLDGIGNIDEIMVAVFRRDGQILKRKLVSNKLYRMSRAGKIESVPKKKGVYRLIRSLDLDSQ
ncbi:hypothetical protein LPB140_02000 [Sphingorhabdus lutea]|uniref:Uncharacterized protein n=1 Tax=Sphingorhabdus lutea TaxID=1913578 RepID=A0A1L3J9K2_9SPHN|nr:hypothetical protein [Sphingorhabdus lutea]APG61807.1 hypothetical protein LPB140_02000 [Sphingorhabdus lutea]